MGFSEAAVAPEKRISSDTGGSGCFARVGRDRRGVAGIRLIQEVGNDSRLRLLSLLFVGIENFSVRDFSAVVAADVNVGLFVDDFSARRRRRFRLHIVLSHQEHFIQAVQRAGAFQVVPTRWRNSGKALSMGNSGTVTKDS